MNSWTSLLLFGSSTAIIYVLYRKAKRTPLWSIPGPKPESFLLGNWCELLQREAGSSDFEWQETYGGVVRFNASFGDEQLMISDPKAMHHSFQTSGYRWRKTPQRREFSRLTSGRGVAWADGEVHKRQRKIMSPGFNAPDAKNLLPFFSSCAAALCARWSDIISASGEQSRTLNVPEWTSRAALDAIGQAAFDVDFKATSNNDTELARLYRSLMARSFGAPSKAAILMLELFQYIPSFVVEFINDHNPRFAPLHDVARVAESTARDLVADKSEALLEGKFQKDIMSVLVKANREESPEARLSEEEMLAQMRVLIFAGHETTANTVAWTLYELARNCRLQGRLRKEIQDAEVKLLARGKSEFTMQDLEAMPLLGAVIKETLRFHPAVAHMFRQSVENDVLPLSKPITTTTGEILNEIPVPKGTKIIASVAAYNRDKSIFGDDAFEFNPDRWLEPGHVDQGVSLGVYANLATFSAGIRSCLGWRFAVIELNAFLVELIRNFEFATTPEVTKIRREAALVVVPMIDGELEKGSQLPLKVSFASRGAE